MADCVFTIDYEIYGDGRGSLAELVHDPTERLAALFEDYGARLVVFVEAAELERLAGAGSDSGYDSVERQIRRLHESGHEIGLHLHAQWYRARLVGGGWRMHEPEYNLSALAEPRIREIVDQGVSYLRRVLRDREFTPLSFRAGNWLFQPSLHLANALADAGIRVDSSVFKGGLQTANGLDYRRAARNGPYWRFTADIQRPEPDGRLLEIPISTEMVPCWRMATSKRLSLQRQSSSVVSNKRSALSRLRDVARFRYPRKLDFSRMEPTEFIDAVEAHVRYTETRSTAYEPIVAIGHSKDLVDVSAVRREIQYLNANSIAIRTLRDVLTRCDAYVREGSVR